MLKIDSITIGETVWTDVEVEFAEYASGGLTAIELWTNEDGWREPLATVTVNIVSDPPAEGCVWVKDYSENAGMLLEMVRLGILEPTGRYTQAGFVSVPEARILKRA